MKTIIMKVTMIIPLDHYPTDPDLMPLDHCLTDPDLMHQILDDHVPILNHHPSHQEESLVLFIKI